MFLFYDYSLIVVTVHFLSDFNALSVTVFDFCFACRLSEQSRLVAEQKRLVTELRGKYEEAQQWNLKYKVQ